MRLKSWGCALCPTPASADLPEQMLGQMDHVRGEAIWPVAVRRLSAAGADAAIRLHQRSDCKGRSSPAMSGHFLMDDDKIRMSAVCN